MSRLAGRLAAAAAIVAGMAAFGPARAQQAAVAPPATAVQPAARPPLLTEDNLLLFDVSLDQLSITDSLATYAVPDGPLIPLGELSRLLDVDLTVSVPDRRVTGSIGEARRPVLIDVAQGIARIDARTIALSAGDVVVGPTDLYVRPALLEQILPVKVAIDLAALRLALTAREPLPIQSRLDRLSRLRDLQPDLAGSEQVWPVAAPPRLLGPPSFDIALAAALGSRDPTSSTRYDIRAGADALYTGFQGYLGSDDHGRPMTARALFERRDPDGRMFGPFGITRASAGDIFTPGLAIGVRSIGGRGAAVTTAPLSQASVFDRIDLRGEMPIGYDVELYVNDVLRRSQQKPVRGRYEFLDVALVRGLNVVRVVAYGPRGERREDVRVISVGGGQLARGTVQVDIGAVQQGRNLVEPRRLRGLDLEPGRGRPRVVAGIGYGVTSGLTLVGGAGLYAPNDRDERALGTVGVRTSLLGWATQLDAAADSDGGDGVSLGLAGRPFGVATIVRHAEYRGGFVDETIPRGSDGRAMRRYSDIVFDLSALSVGGASVPVTAGIERTQFANGDRYLASRVRASSAFGRALVSAGLDYERFSPRGVASSTRLAGTLTASTFVGYAWQLRGSADFEVRPRAHLRATTLAADRNIGERMAVHLGLGQSFEKDRSSTTQASAIFRLPFGDLSFDSGYSTHRDEWRVGLGFAFSLGFDPLRGRYVARRTGAGSGGNLAVQAFVDADADGVYDAGEAPVAGVVLDSGFEQRATDAAGRAYLSGLGYGAVARVRANVDQIDLANVAAPPGTIQFTPRAGVTAVAMYPITAQGEVLVRILFRQADGSQIGLSAVRLRAVRDGAPPIEAATEYDGSAVFDKLAAGRYRIDIDPEQARRLGMALAEPVVVTVPPEGGVLPDVRAIVAFSGR